MKSNCASAAITNDELNAGTVKRSRKRSAAWAASSKAAMALESMMQAEADSSECQHVETRIADDSVWAFSDDLMAKITAEAADNLDYAHTPVTEVVREAMHTSAPSTRIASTWIANLIHDQPSLDLIQNALGALMGEDEKWRLFVDGDHLQWPKSPGYGLKAGTKVKRVVETLYKQVANDGGATVEMIQARMLGDAIYLALVQREEELAGRRHPEC